MSPSHHRNQSAATSADPLTALNPILVDSATSPHTETFPITPTAWQHHTAKPIASYRTTHFLFDMAHAKNTTLEPLTHFLQQLAPSQRAAMKHLELRINPTALLARQPVGEGVAYRLFVVSAMKFAKLWRAEPEWTLGEAGSGSGLRIVAAAGVGNVWDSVSQRRISVGEAKGQILFLIRRAREQGREDQERAAADARPEPVGEGKRKRKRKRSLWSAIAGWFHLGRSQSSIR